MSNASINTFTGAFRQRNFAVVADWFAFVFFWVGAVAIVASAGAAWAALGGEGAIRVLAIGGIFAAACGICGWLLGLLFGIPRSLARPQPASSQAPANAAISTRPNRVNTNLEDVSDWLTKTLIGVGLTQLTVLPGFLWRVAEKVNAYGLGWPKTGQLLALSLLVYFAVGGFWLGYIATRTILTKLFDVMESIDDRTVEIALAPGHLGLEVTANRIVPTKDSQVAAADRALLKLNIHELTSARQLAAWGAAKARAGDLAVAAVALQQSLEADPLDAAAEEALFKVLRASGRKEEASGMLQQAPPTETALVAALYADTKEGARRAIEIGRALSGSTGSGGSLNLHVWLACAYGQEHKWAKREGDEATADRARLSAIEEIGKALKVDPSVKPWLKSLWMPEQGALDDDLATLPKDDKALRSLLL